MLWDRRRKLIHCSSVAVESLDIYRFVGGGIGPVLSCGALSVGSPPSLVGCDLVCGSLRHVVSSLSERVKGRRGVLLGSPPVGDQP